MSTGERVSLDTATVVAHALVDALRPSALRIEIAGSIRRRRETVADIELVAVPRIASHVVPRLLEDDVEEVDVLQEALEQMLVAGVLKPHPTDPKRGTRYSKVIEARSGIQVDLFTARPTTFGLIWMIRTGPAEYSRGLVIFARSRGFHVAGGEMHVGSLGCSATPCTFVPTPEEDDVYRVLGAHPIPPEKRR